MHAKPCFYCIILLAILFSSSCYWQPFPLDRPLTAPWADNVTTFAQALNETLQQNYSQPLPTIMNVIDRCWCEFSTGSFFEPFNVSRWEYLSVQRVAKELLDKETKETSRNETEQSFLSVNETTAAPELKFWWLRSFSSKTSSSAEPSPTEISPTVEKEDATVEDQSSTPIHIFPPESLHALPFLQKEYDLRQINLGMIVDLGW